MILAEIDIPDIWSLRSVLSVFGMIYFIVCLTIYGTQGFVKGMGTMCVFLMIGLFLVAGATEDTKGEWEGAFHTRIICYEDVRHTKQIKTMSSDEYNYRVGQNEDLFPDRDIVYWDREKKIFAMHDPDCNDYICSPWVFHPACLVYCPAVFCIPVLIIGGAVTNKMRG